MSLSRKFKYMAYNISSMTNIHIDPEISYKLFTIVFVSLQYQKVNRYVGRMNDISEHALETTQIENIIPKYTKNEVFTNHSY